jgi:phosphatidylglycerophosphatase A
MSKEGADARALRPGAAWLCDPGHFLALGGGTGLSPWAPGTFGTLAGMVVYLPLSYTTPGIFWCVTAVLFVVGVPLCGRTARASGVHDHGAIVLDEVVGFLVVAGFSNGSLESLLAGFVAFRFFDILKPWPIRLLDRRVGGGFGIMLDDLAAAVYAVVTVLGFEAVYPGG